MSTSTSSDSIPDGWKETMDENNWSEEEREAWRVLHEARPGDLVLWSDRSIAMEVVDREQDEEGHHVLTVDKPRGEGTYEVHERYNNGKAKFTSPIGRATNLHFVERQPEPRDISEDEYEALVERMVENAIDAFIRLDYQDWDATVSDVVENWGEDVALRRWRGYKHHPDWQDGDPEAIFESVAKHSERGETTESDLSVRERAEVALYDDVYVEGRDMAESRLVADEGDYDELVERMAHLSVDRYDRKNYPDARHATRDTISDWVDDRQEQAYLSIIEYGTPRFDEADYSGLDEETASREMAFDILDHDVWEQVQREQRDRGEHDPTVRGLTYTNYHDVVDALVEKTLKQYDGRGFLRTTVQDIVEEWADSVEAHEWEGHRYRVYADGDVEDIFASVAVHSDANPFVWNPIASDKERRMAVQALTSDVVVAAENAIDHRGEGAIMVPVDEYLQDYLGMDDVDYSDFTAAHPEDIEETVARVFDSVEGDEVGWTFVDEIIEHGGRVPEMTNDWLLVDYGVIREAETQRRLAWFNRETGSVLVLSGRAAAPPDELRDADEPYEQFHLQIVEYGEDGSDYITTDVSLEEALNAAYDFLDADRADFRVIESRDDVWVQDHVTDEDINAGGVIDSLIPNMTWGGDDLLTLADSRARSLGNTLDYWGPELAKMTGYVTLAVAPKWLGDRLDGIRVEPNIDKQHGVGTNISKEFGAAPYEDGVGGKAEVEVNARPETFKKLGNKFAPKFVRRGLDEGDVGKGVVESAGAAVDSARSNPWGQEFLDEFGGSITSFFEVLDAGQGSATEDRMRREFVADFYQRDQDNLSQEEVDELWDDIAYEVRDDYDEYVQDEVDSAGWDDLSDEDVGISGMLMRGLDAERIVSGMEFLNVDDWLHRNTTLYGSDYVNGDPPTFEEWKEERFGPGKPAGPEEEARMMARFHKEVAGAGDAPDPLAELGIDEEQVGHIEDEQDALGDYNNSEYNSDDTFGNDFDDVADKFIADEPANDDE